MRQTSVKHFRLLVFVGFTLEQEDSFKAEASANKSCSVLQFCRSNIPNSVNQLLCKLLDAFVCDAFSLTASKESQIIYLERDYEYIYCRNWLLKRSNNSASIFMPCSKHRVPSRTDGLHTANDPPVCPLKNAIPSQSILQSLCTSKMFLATHRHTPETQLPLHHTV